MSVTVGPSVEVHTLPDDGVAQHVTVVVGARGRPVVAAWRDVGTPAARLMLLRQEDDGWASELVVRSPGAFCSLVSARDGSTMIAYADLSTSAIMLARQPSGSTEWLIETVAHAGLGLLAGAPALSLTTDGTPEVCFASDEGPRLATRAADGSWSTQAPDPVTSLAADVALAIGDDGEHQLLVRDALAGSLVHLRNGSGDWVRQLVPWRADGVTDGFLGDGPILALDQQGVAHVAVWTHEGIRHAVLAKDGSWETELAIPDVGAPPALAIGPDGHPALACSSPTDSGVVCARRGETGWEREPVANSGSPRLGGAVSMAFDAAGLLHLVFVDDHTGEICATRLGEAPTQGTIAFRTTVDTTVWGSVFEAALDPGDLTLVTEPVAGPGHGRLRLQQDGRFSYSPDRGYHGPDVFEYAVMRRSGVRSAGAVRIDVDVPTLVTVTQKRLRRRRRPTIVKIALPPARLRGLCVTLQRRRGDAWVDLGTRKGARLGLLMRAGRKGWPPGPYRLEIRPAKQTYPLARSKEFPKPPARGVHVVVSGDLSTLPRLAGSTTHAHART